MWDLSVFPPLSPPMWFHFIRNRREMCVHDKEAVQRQSQSRIEFPFLIICVHCQWKFHYCCLLSPSRRERETSSFHSICLSGRSSSRDIKTTVDSCDRVWIFIFPTLAEQVEKKYYFSFSLLSHIYDMCVLTLLGRGPLETSQYWRDEFSSLSRSFLHLLFAQVEAPQPQTLYEHFFFLHFPILLSETKSKA